MECVDVYSENRMPVADVAKRFSPMADIVALLLMRLKSDLVICYKLLCKNSLVINLSDLFIKDGSWREHSPGSTMTEDYVVTMYF